PTENRTRDCSANIHIKRSVAVQFLDARNKLPHEIHRAARQTHLRGHRRFVGHFFFMHNLWNIERKVSSQLERLNFRLLQFSRNRQLLALRLLSEMVTRRWEFGPSMFMTSWLIHDERAVQ